LDNPETEAVIRRHNTGASIIMPGQSMNLKEWAKCLITKRGSKVAGSSKNKPDKKVCPGYNP
jgi:hypothetical protein